MPEDTDYVGRFLKRYCDLMSFDIISVTHFGTDKTDNESVLFFGYFKFSIRNKKKRKRGDETESLLFALQLSSNSPIDISGMTSKAYLKNKKANVCRFFTCDFYTIGDKEHVLTPNPEHPDVTRDDFSMAEKNEEALSKSGMIGIKGISLYGDRCVSHVTPGWLKCASEKEPVFVDDGSVRIRSRDESMEAKYKIKDDVVYYTGLGFKNAKQAISELVPAMKSIGIDPSALIMRLSV